MFLDYTSSLKNLFSVKGNLTKKYHYIGHMCDACVVWTCTDILGPFLCTEETINGTMYLNMLEN